MQKTARFDLSAAHARPEPDGKEIRNNTANRTAMPSRYMVVEQDGRRLLLIGAGRRMGWVPSEQVIPQEDAIEFFTKRIRENPERVVPVCHARHGASPPERDRRGSGRLR